MYAVCYMKIWILFEQNYEFQNVESSVLQEQYKVCTVSKQRSSAMLCVSYCAVLAISLTVHMCDIKRH